MLLWQRANAWIEGFVISSCWKFKSCLIPKFNFSLSFHHWCSSTVSLETKLSFVSCCNYYSHTFPGTHFCRSWNRQKGWVIFSAVAGKQTRGTGSAREHGNCSATRSLITFIARVLYFIISWSKSVKIGQVWLCQNKDTLCSQCVE